MKYSKYFGAKRRGFIKSISVLVPKGVIHLLNENVRYDTADAASAIVTFRAFVENFSDFSIPQI